MAWVEGLRSPLTLSQVAVAGHRHVLEIASPPGCRVGGLCASATHFHLTATQGMRVAPHGQSPLLAATEVHHESSEPKPVGSLITPDIGCVCHDVPSVLPAVGPLGPGRSVTTGLGAYVAAVLTVRNLEGVRLSHAA